MKLLTKNIKNFIFWLALTSFLVIVFGVFIFLINSKKLESGLLDYAGYFLIFSLIFSISFLIISMLKISSKETEEKSNFIEYVFLFFKTMQKVKTEMLNNREHRKGRKVLYYLSSMAVVLYLIELLQGFFPSWTFLDIVSSVVFWLTILGVIKISYKK